MVPRMIAYGQMMYRAEGYLLEELPFIGYLALDFLHLLYLIIYHDKN